ncbi:MAG: hypothetical protein AAF587_29510 [Bacteroidota bacterium]
MDIISFQWDMSDGKDYNGKSLIIGQHLPKRQNHDMTHVDVYGISIDIIDQSKDFRLKRLSCYSEYITDRLRKISKQEARQLIIEKIDDALNILFDPNEMKDVEECLNVYKQP